MPPSGRVIATWGRAAAALAAGLVGCVVVLAATGLLTGSVVGAADNGDGRRIACGAGLYPDTPNGQAFHQGAVVIDYVRGPACPSVLLGFPPQPSSALTLLRVASVGDTDPWPLTRLGWLYAALAGLVTAAAAWCATAAGPSRVLALVPALTPLAHPDFARFFVSTFTEPAGLLGVYAVCAGTSALLVLPTVCRGARVGAATIVAAGGVLAATAKPGYLPVLAVAAVVVAFTALPLCARQARWSGRVVGPVLALAAVLVALPTVQAARTWLPDAYPAVNAHNVAFTLVLPEVGLDALGPLGLPPSLGAYSGRGFWNPVEPYDLPGWQAAVGDRPAQVQRAAWSQLVTHPDALARATLTALAATQARGLPYLPADPYLPGSAPAGLPDQPGIQGFTAPAFRAWLDTLPTLWWPPLLTAIGVGAGLIGCRARRGSPAAFAGLAGVSATTALGVAVVAVVGDGYYELAKHVWLAAYLVDVTMCALAVAAFAALIGRFRTRHQA